MKAMRIVLLSGTATGLLIAAPALAAAKLLVSQTT